MISIIVTSYEGSSLNDISDLFASIKAQTNQDFEVIYVTEGSEDLYAFVKRETFGMNGPATVVQNDAQTGLAEARNLGASLAKGEIICFVDDDVVLHPFWAGAVVAALDKGTEIAGITGPAFPLWEVENLNWVPIAFDWLIGCTRWYHSNRIVEVANCWGMNMAFRRSSFFEVNGFSTGVTEKSRYLRPGARKRNREEDAGKAIGIAEDVGISIKMRRKRLKLCYVPDMLVHHKVYPYRVSAEFVIRRASFIGFSRRKVRNSLSGPEFKILEKERGLLFGAAKEILFSRKSVHTNLEDIKKRIRLTILVLFSLMYGYLFSPI